MAYDYDLIHVAVDDGVAVATIDAPPMNVMTIALYGELVAFTAEVEVDDAVRVVVLRSADPDFFIAHFDVEAILMFPIDGEPVRATSPNPFHSMC
jgi:enoyl-CoA hydratase/carnithine racemase